jgi:hypothetical protein
MPAAMLLVWLGVVLVEGLGIVVLGLLARLLLIVLSEPQLGQLEGQLQPVERQPVEERVTNPQAASRSIHRERKTCMARASLSCPAWPNAAAEDSLPRQAAQTPPPRPACNPNAPLHPAIGWLQRRN